MDTLEIFEYQWPYLLGCLPDIDLDKDAKEWGALKRRREVDSASTLLRLAMLYGYCGMSLRESAAWAEAAGVASLSDVALLNRLSGASSWLGHILSVKLAESLPPPFVEEGRYVVKLIDATTINQPACKGTDLRLHLGYDLARQAFDHLELTDNKGGESLKRFTFAPGDLAVADRGYSRRTDLFHVVQAEADFLVRVNWMILPLQTLDGMPFDPVSELRSLGEAEPQSFILQIAASPKHGQPAIPVQLIAVRRSEAAAAEARQQMIAEYNKKRSRLQERTLELAGYICLVTSLGPEELSAARALELYRYRWQVEIVFKRLKGLLELGTLPAKKPELARAIVFAKLIAALILEDYTRAYLDFFPWGYRMRRTASVDLANTKDTDR